MTFNIEKKKKLSDANSVACYRKKSCGVSYNLIDNGGYYWFATPSGVSSTATFYWNPSHRIVDRSSSSIARGVRPVLRLASSVKVTGGSGTYEDPYTISNSG